jgi:hypothetical protein
LDPSYIWLFHIYFIQCSLRLLNLWVQIIYQFLCHIFKWYINSIFSRSHSGNTIYIYIYIYILYIIQYKYIIYIIQYTILYIYIIWTLYICDHF